MLDTTFYLKRTVDLARNGAGRCAPNPCVGALIVKDGEIVAEGYHTGPGRPHAEVEALNLLKLKGISPERCTLFVSLEPCCHFGRTPPCTRAILEAGIGSVVFGHKDPNPVVSGKGQTELSKAGVEVSHLCLPEVEAFYRAYDYWTETKLPWVTAKIALSLDGKYAKEKGKRFQLTGAIAEERTHQGRKLADAILTSSETILVDDPRFDVRTGNPANPTSEKRPLYVMDSQNRIPSTARIFDTTLKVIRLSGSLTASLEQIGRDGVHSLWVEAGGNLFSALVKQGLCQESLIYIAPLFLGDGLEVPLESISREPKSQHWESLGKDALLHILW